MAEPEVRVTLTVLEGDDHGLSVQLEEPRTNIGRKGAGILLSDSKVSSTHAEIEIDGKRVLIRDLHSRNGVYVNGKKIEESELKNLDEITLGLTKLKVLIVEDLETFKTRNLSVAARSDPAPKRGKGEIAYLIDDEMKRFSKWDLAGGQEDPLPGAARSEYAYILEILKGPDAGRKVRVDKETTTLGRGKADVAFRDEDVSRLHAAMEIGSNGQLVIRDLGSTNGTFVNSKRVTEAELRENDLVQLGSTIIRIRPSS